MSNDPPSADEDVARLRLVLRNTPLSTLEEYGLVTHDRAGNVVRKGPRFDAINMLSNPSNDHDGEVSDGYR